MSLSILTSLEIPEIGRCVYCSEKDKPCVPIPAGTNGDDLEDDDIYMDDNYETRRHYCSVILV